MIKTLKLNNGYGKFIETNEYVKVDNDCLTIQIVTNFGHNVELYAKISNGVEEKSIKIKDKKFEIENEFLYVGECFLKIVAMINGNITQEYICTPLLIKEINNEKLIIDKIEDFKIQLNEFLTEYQEEKEYIRYELNKMQKAIKELIIAE